jgi:serine/threonine protein kinase
MDGSGTGTGGAGRQFQFVRRIGSGGFGDVYLAEMSSSSGFAKMVAVKLLKLDMENNPNVAQRMRDEARLLGMLRHKTIVRADDLINLHGRTAVIMEYVPGCNLSAAIDPGRNTGAFPHRAIIGVIRNIASALDVAYHRPSPVTGNPLGVLHRDIKPGNVRITPDGEVKVLDFGIARSEGINREAQTTEYQLGSLNYMAPELLNSGDASPASDIYSLGVTFYECLARERFGWAGEAEDMHTPKLDKRFAGLDMESSGDQATALIELLRDMMRFSPDDRPSPDKVIARCRALESELPGLTLEDWASTAIEALKDPESLEDDDKGEFSGQILFEEVSTASFSPQLLGNFTEEATMAMPGAAAELMAHGAAPKARRRWPEFTILILLLAVAGGVFLSQSALTPTETTSTKTRIAHPSKKAQEMAAAKMEEEIRAKLVTEANAKAATEAAAAAVPEVTQPATPAPTTPAIPAAAQPTATPIPVRIASMPMGLPVFIDGRPMGTTPVSNAVLSPGTHRLVIRDGDRNISKRIRVVAGGSNFWRYVQAEGRIR